MHLTPSSAPGLLRDFKGPAQLLLHQGAFLSTHSNYALDVYLACGTYPRAAWCFLLRLLPTSWHELLKTRAVDWTVSPLIHVLKRSRLQVAAFGDGTCKQEIKVR